jgi:hypothetical protein
MLQNGNFSAGWTDMPPTPNHLINQKPNHWALRWIVPGQPLFGSADLAAGVPECVHKLSEQLPPEEQLSGSQALVLSGTATYKIFHSGLAFGAELRQRVEGLAPNTPATLTAPVLAVLYEDPDPFGAESGAWVNGQGRWANGGEMGSRNWFRHVVNFTVPADGVATVVIRVKSKWPRPKDFFVDGVTLQATPANGSSITEPKPTNKVRVSVPAGLQLVVTTCHTPGVVVVSTPEGVEVDAL